MPFALTDDELAVVQRFATPLHPNQRGEYLKRVAALLDGHEVGPGLLHRACEQAQLEYRRPTVAINGRGNSGVGKYAR
jgi:hypothetical protein